jgi:diguanylate cyclase (GGDEF)-like protein
MADFSVTVHEEPLAKAEPELYQHLAAIRAASPESARFLAQRLFSDSMVKGVGNKLAFEDFLTRKRGGVHVMLDGNDFGVINKKWGQSTGDEAIKAMGAAISRASRANKGKLFRVGGDEFRAHFDTPEQAYSFARNVRQELESLPPVRGEHFHSVSLGMGESPEHAENSLIQAKGAKKLRGYVPGQAQTHAHSLLPGAVGEVPVESAPPEVPPGLSKPPVKPGTSPMQLQTADKPWPLRKSEVPTVLIHDNPARPAPVYFLGNDDGLSPDGAAFLNVEDLADWYGGLVEPRRYGYVPRRVLAKSIRRSEEGWVTFEAI